jgi:hypothetical protein
MHMLAVLLADIAHGETGWSDTLFLIAAIWAAVIAAYLLVSSGELLKGVVAACIPGVLCLACIAWLLL